jgi:hypothetical protein
MTRGEKVAFCIKAIWEIEEACVGVAYFEDYTDDQLDEKVEWFEYLLSK